MHIEHSYDVRSNLYISKQGGIEWGIFNPDFAMINDRVTAKCGNTPVTIIFPRYIFLEEKKFESSHLHQPLNRLVSSCVSVEKFLEAGDVRLLIFNKLHHFIK